MRGEPNNQGNEDCAAMYKGRNGEWNDARCGTKFNFVCEIGAVAAKLCPVQSFKFAFQGVGYEVVKTRKTWHEAEKHCKGIKGHLATITSKKVDDALLQQMKRRLVFP